MDTIKGWLGMGGGEGDEGEAPEQPPRMVNLGDQATMKAYMDESVINVR